MSSSYVRSAFKDFIEAEIAPEVLVDLTAEYRDIKDLLSENSISDRQNWSGIDFLSDGEEPITVGSDNTKGKYRETGAVFIHIVGVAKLGVADTILARAESLRAKLRGKRLGVGGRVIVDAVGPPNFSEGATLTFESGFMSATMIASYEYDNDL